MLCYVPFFLLACKNLAFNTQLVVNKSSSFSRSSKTNVTDFSEWTISNEVMLDYWIVLFDA